GAGKRITAIGDGDMVATKDGPRSAGGVRPSGVRQVGRLTLANGRSVRCTPDHPIFTQRGWVDAEKLARDDSVAVFDSVAAAFERVAVRRRGGDATLVKSPMAGAGPGSCCLEDGEPPN